MKDWAIPICIVVLAGFGGAVIGSVAPEFLPSQLFFYLAGLMIFYFFSKVDYHLYSSLSGVIYILSLVLLAITLFIGFETRGSVRWIPLGPVHLQFSEILKPFLVAAFAGVLTGKQKRSNFESFVFHCLWLLPPVLLVLKQPDLGSAVVYFFAFLAMIFVAGANPLYFLAGVVPSFLAIPLAWKALADYQKNRVISFLYPQADPLGASYNAIQAVISVGSGLLFGKGLGRGTQSHLAFLPERHTDFIFASLAEELGFVGALTVLIFLFLLVWRVLAVAGRTRNSTARVTAAGIAVLLLVQLFINIGMNIGILPVTGITLPLVSYGGSSVISTMIGLGIIENIAKSESFGESTIHIV